jgi:uncharacterized protein YcbX
MAGEELPSAEIGWHGVEGDRRAAFVRSGDRSGFPFLTASKLPSLVTYKPVRDPGAPSNATPLKVMTPGGEVLDLAGEALASELMAAFGGAVALTQWKNGIFDDASISVVTTSTISAVCDAAGVADDPRRFRPNLLVDPTDPSPFADDQWVGKTIQIGEGESAAAIAIWMRDLRCVMVNLDPLTASADARVLRAAAQLNSACAGVYATVVKTGPISIGDHLYVL